MSITSETAAQHKNDPAVICCLKEAGLVISPADLEDPAIFPDLQDSGLLTIPSDTLRLGQVLGAKLKKTLDALTPLTPDVVEGWSALEAEPDHAREVEAELAPEAVAAAPAGGAASVVTGGMVKIRIEEGKGINLEFPTVVMSGAIPASPESAVKTVASLDGGAEPVVKIEDKVLRTLKIREFAVNKVELGDTTSFENGVLTIRKSLAQEALKADPLVKKIEMDIVTPDNKHVFSNTIMDVIPVATKVEGQIGEGISNVLSGMVVVLNGMDEGGLQVHEFGSCEGFMDEKIRYNRPGTPDDSDIMVRIIATIAAGTGMERRGPYAAHKVADVILQEIRAVLKKAPAEQAAKESEAHDISRLGRPRVVLVKEIMGQGAMHDNVILPIEPAGVAGGRPNVDLGNIPIVLSPNEVRDGGIHALTCIGPASKENTRHYFREPLVRLMAEDEEIDLVGVIFVGSPQINDEKSFVSGRVGSTVEALGVEGAIVTTEGFGNNHIDFASHIEQIGKRGVPVVGVSYSAYQGALVVGNKYMDAMIDLNKDSKGFESEVLGDNTLTANDAKRALAMLKTKMAGVSIKPPGRKWDQTVIEGNQKLVDAAK